jgi:hypothetical protein
MLNLSLDDLIARPEEAARAVLDEPGAPSALGLLISADVRSMRRWRTRRVPPPGVACALRVLLAVRLRADAAALAAILRREAEAMEMVARTTPERSDGAPTE